MSGNNLTGHIPESLGDLKGLINLDMSGNNLTGHIPESLGDLKGLINLGLAGNGLTGSIPDSLGNLTSLGTLYLNNNELTGTIPGTLGDLKNLQVLYLYGNNLTGQIPGSLGNLKGLTNLKLRDNKLAGHIPESMGDLTALIELDLFHNKVTGSIPESLGDLKNLQWLHLADNELTGSIPESLMDLKNLQTLRLGLNGLMGSIPESLANLTSLKTLDWGSNRLTGSIPTSLGNLTSLDTLGLYSNELTGSIPESLADLKNLTKLNLSFNNLTGNIPESLGNITGLTNLTLSGNELTGSIPKSFGNLKNLQQLALDGNGLTGSIPESLGNLTNLIHLSLANNFFTSIPPALQYKLPVSSQSFFDKLFLNYSGNCIPNSQGRRSDAECQIHSGVAGPSPAPTVLAPVPLTWQTPTPSLSPIPSVPAPRSGQVPTTQRSSSSTRSWMWLVISITAAPIVFAAVATAFCFAKKRTKKDHAMDLGISTLTTYTLTDIRSMTQNWGAANLLGSGGFGSVYKGVVEGQIVAVKKLKMEGVDDDNKATKEFLNEVAVLSKVRHRNLVALKGICCNRAERILVMEFVNNGNLADHLFYHQEKGLPVLQWSTRCRIATTAAEALHYLHSLNDEKIIHRDIKAENILLDESYNSLVCDFGLAKLTPQLVTGTMPTIATRNVAGTKGYMAPEWLIQGILSDKMDVYSFGIVLLEIVTGANRFKCYSLGDGPDTIYSVHEAAWLVCNTRPDALSLVLDAEITEAVSPATVISILRLALHCISEERRDRPTMERVVRMLKGMIEVPPLPSEPPSWLQEAETKTSPSNGNVLQD